MASSSLAWFRAKMEMRVPTVVERRRWSRLKGILIDFLADEEVEDDKEGEEEEEATEGSERRASSLSLSLLTSLDPLDHSPLSTRRWRKFLGLYIEKARVSVEILEEGF